MRILVSLQSLSGIVAFTGVRLEALEVETKTIEQVREAVRVKPNRIMLDNMSHSKMKKAVKIIRSSCSRVEIEASGGITTEAIPKIRELGLDYVSCGALTHSIKALDISLDLE
jgi:nicotinate-nucleotide pyrophosphorylase (carboxylating)